MLLHLLNQKEKEFFLEFAYLVAKSDNEFAEEEKMVIQQYRREMNLEVISNETKGHNIDEIIFFFKDSLKKIQRSIYIEIYALSLADNDLKKEEDDILNKMQKEFSISDEIKEKTINIVKELKNIYNETLSILDD